MKTTPLQKVFDDAQLCANIVITFVRYASTPEKAMAGVHAGDILGHFARTGRIVIVNTDADKSTMTIAKTPVFKPQDGAELARQIAEVVSEAAAREIPEYTMTLEQCENGWQLRVLGGNKLLRQIFREATITMTQRLYQYDSPVLWDKEGSTAMGINVADETDMLQFAETMAEMFNVSLVL